MPKLSRTEALKHFGASAQSVDRGLTEFRDAAAVMSSDHSRLIDDYPKQWVGVHKGEVEASGSTLKAVMSALARKNIPTDKVMVRYIDRHRRTMIL